MRKKKGDVVLVDVNERGVLNKDRPTKYLLEIAHSTYLAKASTLRQLLISFDLNVFSIF